jgi:translation initiation factor 1
LTSIFHVLPVDGGERLADDEAVSLKNNARLVYSTDRVVTCPGCGWPQRDCRCSDKRVSDATVPTRIVAKLRAEKKGRGGKTVTVVDGLPRNTEFLQELSRELKRACGTGGTVVDGGIELQGELRERLREVLAKRGYIVKG